MLPSRAGFAGQLSAAPGLLDARCFARPKDNFSGSPSPFVLEGGIGPEVAVADISLRHAIAQGTAASPRPAHRHAVTPSPGTRSWSLDTDGCRATGMLARGVRDRQLSQGERSTLPRRRLPQLVAEGGWGEGQGPAERCEAGGLAPRGTLETATAARPKNARCLCGDMDSMARWDGLKPPPFKTVVLQHRHQLSPTPATCQDEAWRSRPPASLLRLVQELRQPAGRLHPGFEHFSMRRLPSSQSGAEMRPSTPDCGSH